MEAEERLYQWDNIKFLLIVFVVMGHVSASMMKQSAALRSIYIFIYSFHMPLFLFINGLFQKPVKALKPQLHKIAAFVSIGMLLKVLYHILDRLAGKQVEFSLTRLSGAYWYMFALAAYIFLAYVFKNWKPYYIMAACLAGGIFSGYADFLGDAFSLSRIVVFSPFYFAGFYLEPALVTRRLENIKWKWVCGAFLVMWLLLCFQYEQFLYQYRNLLTARFPFSQVKLTGCGPLNRMECYFITCLLCLCIICLIPDGKLPVISRLGGRTFQVYFWHNIALNLINIVFPQLNHWLAKEKPGLLYCYVLVFPVLLSTVLSIRLFSFPTKQIASFFKKLRA